MDAGLWKQAKTTVRMAEWPPGEVAEMDFGRHGVLVDGDGKKQAVWALVVVLPYSRHQFVWPLLKQTLEESVAGLEAAWAFFGGAMKCCAQLYGLARSVAGRPKNISASQ